MIWVHSDILCHAKKGVVGFLVWDNCKVVIYLYHICLIFEVLDQSLHVQKGRQKTGLHISYQLSHSPVLPEVTGNHACGS